MAAPVFQTAGTGAGASDADSVAVGKPASLANGDIVVVGISVANIEAGTITKPDANWTTHKETDGTAADHFLGVYSKVITNAAGEPASWTWSWTANSAKAAAGSLRISGADQTTPVVVVGATAEGTGTTATANAITPGVVDCLLIQVTDIDGTGTFSTAVMTERVDNPSGGSGGDGTKAAIQMNTETLSASTTTGTRAVTCTSNQWLSVLLAVQPPTVAPFPPSGRRIYPQILAH